jgi:hypothetical protein
MFRHIEMQHLSFAKNRYDRKSYSIRALANEINQVKGRTGIRTRQQCQRIFRVSEVASTTAKFGSALRLPPTTI